MDEMLHAARQSRNGTSNSGHEKASIVAPNGHAPGTTAVAAAASPGRTRHPNERKPIKPADYGKLKWEFRNKVPGFVDEAGDPLRLKDLYEHMMVFGGSGTGKTYSVLQPLWEECFRSTHLPDGPDRERLKFGALVIEAKGDFRDKTWYLAQHYGRMDDFVAFGPTHLNVVYDMFGDPTESPLQKSNKMLAILKAFSEGKGSSDPFWDNAARKLFLNIFYLHLYVRKRFEAAQSPEEKAKFEIAPMSFEMLNLFLMDKGQPKNAAELRGASETISKQWGVMRDVLAKMRATTMYLEAEVERLAKVVEPLETAVDAELEAYEAEFEQGVPVPDLSDDITSDAPAANEEDEAAWLERMAAKQAVVERKKAAVAAVKMLLSADARDRQGERFTAKCDRLRKSIQNLSTAESDNQRGQISNDIGNIAAELSAVMRRRLGALDDIGESNSKLKEFALQFMDLSEQYVAARDSISRAAQSMPKPAYGALKRLITQYEEVLKEMKKESQLDPIWSYFDQEYLNVANDKTAGSVAMVASNLVSLFVHPPFNKIFAPGATFNFNNVIDRGEIVYLDMPTAFYGAAATVASLVMKIDFFRCMLSRRRLVVRAPDGSLTKTLVNQHRPMFYFCDEFASIVTTGDDTGEAGFMDKVREFECGCLLGTQSLPMLLKKLPENEVDAIMTNTAIKIFLRNTDPKTNKFASELFGMEVKVNATLNQSATEMAFGGNKPIGSRGYTTSYSKGAKFDIGEFTKLQKGEALVCLNSRFRRNQMQKVQFAGRAITPAGDPDAFPLPSTGDY